MTVPLSLMEIGNNEENIASGKITGAVLAIKYSNNFHNLERLN